MENPDNSNEQSKSNKTLSRREFLRRTGLTGAMLFLNGCALGAIREKKPPSSPSPAKPILEASGTPESAQSAQEKFRKLNMEDFWNFYHTLDTYKNKFISDGDGVYFKKIYALCRQVTNDEQVPDKELADVRDGWGENIEGAVEEAFKHISAISIMPVDGASDVPEEVKKNQLSKYARALAPMAMALPKELYLFKFGFAQTTQDYIATKSFSDLNSESAWVDFYHEGTHSADLFFERLKAYLPRENYLKYAAKYFELSTSLLEASTRAQSFEEFNHFWRGTKLGIDLSLPDVRQTRMPIIQNLESQILGNSFENEALNIRYIRLLRAILIQLESINGKKTAHEPPTQEERSLLDNKQVSDLMSWTAYDVLHTLVDSSHDFLSEARVAEVSFEVAQAQNEMNDFRVRTFASFELDPNKKPIERVKEKLGID